MILSAPFIVRPVATTLLSLAIVLAGMLSFFLLPVAPLPQVDIPTISVSASLPGASPETMASSVATPLERSLGSIAGVTEMTSSSTQGSTRVTLQFDLSRDINGAARDVQAAINAARSLLPTSLRSNPTYHKSNPSDAPIMTLAMTSDTLSQGQMYDLASTIVAQKLSQVDGVGEVTVGGSSLPAVRVTVLPGALANRGVSLDDVRTALANANANRPKGVLENDQYHWQVMVNDQLSRAEQYRPLIVAWRDGAPVRVSDVAKVEDSVEDLYQTGFYNQRNAILMIVRRQADANIIETVDAVRAPVSYTHLGRGRAAGAGRHQRGVEPAAQRPAGAADLQQGQPGRRGGADAGDHLAHHAAAAGARPGGHAGRAEAVADSGRCLLYTSRCV